MTAEELAEQISALLSDAVQADCENGVRWLNECAASNYLKEYPETLSALRQIGALCDKVQGLDA